jgi:hydroxypyruvate isomerase
LFGELPYPERVGAARRCDLELVETAWPAAADRELLPALLAEHGVRLALLNCFAGDIDAGERGFLNDPDRRDEALRAFEQVAKLARSTGAPVINMLVGRQLPHVAVVRQREAAGQALAEMAAEAARVGLQVVVEPLNTAENPGYLAPTPEAALELIGPSEAIGVLFDLHHIAMMGCDPELEIDRLGERIGHVQISDFPGRGQPGTGSLPIDRILERLQGAGYSGPLGLEYVPVGRTEDSLEFRSAL